MFRSGHTIFFIVLAFLVFGISGCMLGPDYKRGESEIDSLSGYSSLPPGWDKLPDDANDLDPSLQWWKSFDDPVIDELVQRALDYNYDLKAATARVLEAEALLRESYGRRLPDVQYNWDRSRSKISFISPLGMRQGFVNKTYSHDVTVSYMVDFFGRLKRLQKASYADFLSTRANRQALVHSLIAQVVKARVQVNIQQRLLATSRANIKSRTNTLKIVEGRYRQGLTSPLDVYLARENLATSLSAEPLLAQSVKLAQHSLEVLIGTLPATTDILPETLPDIPDVSPIPTGLPVSLLDRRPDIMALEYQVEAATNRVGASIAEMYPDLTLIGRGGYQADHFRDLFDIENQVYSFIINAAAPIYKGGTLKARVQAAEARVQEAAAGYAGGILKALQEVEDALVRQEYIVKSMEYQVGRLDQALKGEKLSNDRYAQGLEGILIVLDSERRRRQAEDQLIETKGRLFDARVDLFLSLGGYWGEYQDSDKETETVSRQ